MKKLLSTALILILIFSAAGCAAPKDNASASASATAEPTADYRTISPGDVKRMMEDGDDIIIVDVRTAEEYSGGHLEGAINIPVETISDIKPAELPDMDAEIVIYCRTGNRTLTAFERLAALGYTDVYDMGGIVDWPYETVTQTAAVTESAPPSASEAPDGVLSAFRAMDIDGNPVDASIFNGKKLTMVNVWATFCGPCLGEMPDLGDLNRQYAGQGFQIVGIVTDVTDSDGAPIPEMIELVGEIIAKTKADYLHILPSEDLNGLLGEFEYVPTTLFVDENGRQVGELYVGSQSGDDWAMIIENLLQEVG
jgi:rhodanese-related sulfurtransferase/thiol-disulfide isomerase/thioredoxin